VIRQVLILLVLMALSARMATAQQRRAPPPKFERQQWGKIFFTDWREGIRGERPPLASLRQPNTATAEPRDVTAKPAAAEQSTGPWRDLIRPAALEDEVKRLKLHFDSVVTTPSAFNSGGFQTARVDLSVLATLMAVIHEYGGDVRWQEHAAAARDVLARTAYNSKAASAQVYNEARRRKADLQDLLSGSGVSASSEVSAANDWSNIADRAPLMEYAEQLIERLEDAALSTEPKEQEIARNAQLVAVLGEVLVQPGMVDADDEDYVTLSRAMSAAGSELANTLEQGSLDRVPSAVNEIRRRCDACHEQYR